MNRAFHTSRFLLVLLTPAVLSTRGAAGDPTTRTWSDPQGDALVRRTDFGNSAQLIPGATVPDLLSVTLGCWSTPTPTTDRYAGTFVPASGACMLRLDIVVKGLVNPPGRVSPDPGFHIPTQFGNSPLFGTFEFDVDNDYDTGGEAPFFYPATYLAQAGRFGTVPQHLADRAILTPWNFDTDVGTAPFYERSGTDFALALCGCTSATLISQDGNMDDLMDAGETMVVRSRFFLRATGYIDASFCFGGSDFGIYDPQVDLRFKHDIASNSTTVSMVFPLTMHGAALLAGEPDQPEDFNVGNHTSVSEALSDVIQYVNTHNLNGHAALIAQGWAGRSASSYLNVVNWRCTALVGTAYPSPVFAADYVWTDAGFDLLASDCNGDGVITTADRQAVIDFIAQADGVFGEDDDGTVNGSILLPGFAEKFAAYDINYDGLVDAIDITSFPNVCPANWNGVNGVTSDDFFAFIADFFSNQADFDGNGITNSQDFLSFLSAFFTGC